MWTKLESLSGGSGVHVFLVLWKAARAVESYAEKSITDLKMCGSDFAVLEALLHKGPLPVNEIGKKVLLTSGSITVAVDRLEKKGLVARRAHGTDRRARIVYLTKAGRKVIKRVYAELHQQGKAHSVEVWAGGDLAGGVYGVHLGGAFFAEVGVGLQTEPADDGLERRVVGRVGPFPARVEAVRAGYARGSRWFDEHPGFQ